MGIREKNIKYNYSTFVQKMMNNFEAFKDYEREVKINNLNYVEYEPNLTITQCPEPITFIKEITKENSTESKVEKFKELSKNFPKYKIQKPEDLIWLNKTTNGINLRLGNKDGDSYQQTPATLGDDCVHGLAVGRTGSGKSVLINNILLNLITEYPPWELDLFLVDMKKVELSRYMKTTPENEYITPHIVACGATSEVRYVLTMLQYISNCMKARQDLFASLGIQKIQDFREKYNIVMPRVLLVVDEFQQLFLEATISEGNLLNDCITNITKLGRATGFHLFFASQEMSGDLSSKLQANFKLRIALSCDDNVSLNVLGNNAASKIESKGITLVNLKGGSGVEDNKEYHTPFVEVNEANVGKDDSEFSLHLNTIYRASQKCEFKKIQKFYQEDVQENISVIENFKKHPNIIRQTNEILSTNTNLLDSIILGTSVIYNNKKNDYVSFFLERGKKKNIAVLCTKDVDLVNIVKTLAENFKNSQLKYHHRVVVENEMLHELYQSFASSNNDIDDLLLHDLASNGNCAEKLNYEQLIKISQNTLEINKWLSSLDYAKLTRLDLVNIYLTKKLSNDEVLSEFTTEILSDFFNSAKDKEYDNCNDILNELKKIKLMSVYNELNQIELDLNAKYENTENVSLENEILININENQDKIKNIFNILTSFNDSKTNQTITQIEKSFINKKYIRDEMINVHWILGIENISSNSTFELSKHLEFCTNENIIFVLVGNEFDSVSETFKCCNYIFMNMKVENPYTRFGMTMTNKNYNNKSIDFKIMNYNQECSYKALFCKTKERKAPSIDFDNL